MKSISRRKVLSYGIKGAALAASSPVLSQASPTPSFSREHRNSSKIVVIGAGAFGGWTALHLLQQGHDVTLVDQFGPGNNQSSSGGETRLIRAYYDDPVYFNMALRSMELWKKFEPLMRQKVFHQNGLLLFNYADKTPETEAAFPIYQQANLPLEKISKEKAKERWPQISVENLDHVMYDPGAGFLESRLGCQEVYELFVKNGGNFIQQQVTQPGISGGKATSITLADGSKVEGDHFVFACGPWLTRLFPSLTKKLTVFRALCFFFASPAGISDLMENQLPTWMDRDLEGPFRSFGVPGSSSRGFKVGLTPPNHNITDRFDTYDRTVKPEELELARGILAMRFPKMVGQPLIEQRVCQYTMTPDSDFILDKHPEADNLWLMGGDSGHGYKQGAAFGELASLTITGEEPLKEKFSLKRLL